MHKQGEVVFELHPLHLLHLIMLLHFIKFLTYGISMSWYPDVAFLYANFYATGETGY